MKILHIINNLATGGAEKLLLESLPVYIEKNIHVELLLLNGTNFPFLEKLKQSNSCTIHHLGYKSVYNPIHIIKLIPFLKEYSIIHVHLFPAFYWVAIAKFISRSKVVLLYTEHSTSNRRIRSKLWQIIDKLIYKNYTTIICITNEVKTVIQNHLNIDGSKCSVIQNGVPISKFSNANPISKQDLPGYSPEAKFMIQVASFHEPKDQQFLIKTMLQLPKKFKLLLVGVGPKKQESEKLVTDLKLEDRVFFLNQRMDVPELLKTVDYVILSSKYEGLSLSSIEGMASGKPFLASNVPGLKEVVAGGGLLFEHGNNQVLSSLILKLYNDPTYYKEIANQCVKKASEYDISIMVQKNIALYEQLA